MLDLSNVWNLDYMWTVFAFILKTVAPFLMIIIGILSVGLLLIMVVRAVKNAVKN